MYELYGIELDSATNWKALADDIRVLPVGLLRLGKRDALRTFLALRWETKEVGEVVFHSGVHAVAPKFERDRWNADLAAVVDQFGLDVAEGPGWFTLNSED
jgi:hypothetical protein